MEFDLQEELQLLEDVATYDIPHEHDISSMDARTVSALLEGAVESITDSSDNITDPQVFDAYRSLLKHAEHLQGTTMSKLLDSISSAFQAQVDASMRDTETEEQETFASHKMALEMYAFLLQWFVSAAEKVKATGEEDAPAAAPRARRGRGGKAAAARAVASRRSEHWSWQDQIPAALMLASKVLRLKTQRLWTTTPERDTFINCLLNPAHRISQNEGYMKSQEIRLGVYKCICLAVKHHGHILAAQITIMQNLQYYEHLSEPMAECLTILSKEFDHSQLCDEILREIAGKTFNAQDTKGPRAFSRFLVRLTELAPRLVLKQISLLLTHLDSESYPMRMALVEVIGHLIREIAVSADLNMDPQQSQKQLNGLYDLLLERTLDLSSYVRTRVLSTLAKLCDLPVKFPKQRLAITRAAVDCLKDKAAGVRKTAVSLIVKLIVTHPYGLMHGGLLGLREWKTRYDNVVEELQKVEREVAKAVQQVDGDAGGDGEEDKDGEEDEEDEAEDGEGDETEERASKKKRSKKSHEGSGDEMDVDDDEENESAEAREDGDVDMADGEEREEAQPKRKKKPRKSQLNIDALQSEAEAIAILDSNEMLHLKLRKRYYAEGLSFIRLVEDGMKVIEQLLASTSKAEVLEAMEFYRVAYEYQFDGAEVGIKKMLHLIWHKDHSATSEDGKELKGIRPRLLECYRSLYFDALPDMEPKQQVNRIAKNMIELTYDATLAELTSLEEMLRIMMEDDQIHNDVITKLWQVYSSERPLPRAQRRGAVIILGMLALARRSVVADRVDTLVKTGLGKLGQSDLLLARYTCVAIQRLNGSAKKVKGSLLDKTIRLQLDNPLFKKLQDALEHPCRHKDWFGMAEQAINTVYALAERPDIFCDRLIKNLTRRVFGPKPDKPSRAASVAAPEAAADPDAMVLDEENSENAENAEANPSQGAASANGSPDGGDKDAGDAFELSQLLFVVGHVAIKQIVFLELVEREMKRQKHEREQAAKAARGPEADRNAARDTVEELDQVAGNVEDDIGEKIATMREIELVVDTNSLLATFGPMLVHITGSPHKYKNRTLRAAATLAFSKFLCVSSHFCDQHHGLLFRVLESSKDPSIRSNIVIALGDVAVSFSTIVDENSNELYRGLSDKDIIVKKNTLMVLTHLILNGMIKVKGQLGEMAKCLEDDDERVADLAKLFFSELATKDNAIYNNLPDVISHLSMGDHAVDEEAFQSTMKYIFKFIEKEKQAENIVEKLCQRFRLSEDARQWRDIAFCLSLLPFKSERSVKKLVEGLPFYRDKLHEPDVYARFQEILAKARSNKSPSKPETELNEFENILDEHRRQGAEDQAFEKRVEKNKAAARKKATRRTARKKAVPQDEQDEE
ncbi:condensin complex subunit 1 [Phanerochaete sordida]|uniref:Condensin complex subunit 1 n=1 Tax=Phanerochaete sordida TaxID=48140 RepID=A0A9P3LBS8_9APHY|nr:condensin complex subunit 1 [Phanerochaete sordida]